MANNIYRRLEIHVATGRPTILWRKENPDRPMWASLRAFHRKYDCYLLTASYLPEYQIESIKRSHVPFSLFRRSRQEVYVLSCSRHTQILDLGQDNKQRRNQKLFQAFFSVSPPKKISSPGKRSYQPAYLWKISNHGRGQELTKVSLKLKWKEIVYSVGAWRRQKISDRLYSWGSFQEGKLSMMRCDL